jgi:hypothetical protein
MPSSENSEIFVITPADGCPATANFLSLDASLAILTRVLRFEDSKCVIAHRSDRYPQVRQVRPTGQTGLELLHHRLRFFSLGFVDQPRNLVVFW